MQAHSLTPREIYWFLSSLGVKARVTRESNPVLRTGILPVIQLDWLEAYPTNGDGFRRFSVESQ